MKELEIKIQEIAKEIETNNKVIEQAKSQNAILKAKSKSYEKLLKKLNEIEK